MLNSSHVTKANGIYSIFGFTRSESVFFLSLFVLLSLCAWKYFSQLRPDKALVKAKAINVFLIQSATDNDSIWPVGKGTTAEGTSEGIARNLLGDQYASDPAIFALTSATYSGKGGDFSDFTAAQIDWDFTAGATAHQGLTSADSDLLPTVFCTGETVTYPQAGSALVHRDLPLSGKGAFGTSGIVVAYKNGTVVFIKAYTGMGQAVAPGFFPAGLPVKGPYTQIKPGR